MMDKQTVPCSHGHLTYRIFDALGNQMQAPNNGLESVSTVVRAS